MSDPPEARVRRRWINFGEVIGVAALIISALGVWIAWKNSSEDKPTRIVEQRQAIPLTLRGKAENDGRQMVVSPVESSHALESLTVTIKGAPAIEVGSDGELDASDVATALKDRVKESKDSIHSVPVRIEARYVEAGNERRAGGNYVLSYKWEGGGLFGGRSLHLSGLRR